MAATAQSAIAVIGIDIGKNSFQGLRIQEYARVRARESKVSREMVANYSRPTRLLQLVLMPARMRDLLPTPLPNLNIAQWDEPPP